MSYPLRSLLIVMTMLAVLCAISMGSLPAGVVKELAWMGDAWPHFVPGVMTVGVCLILAIDRPSRIPQAALAVLACTGAMASPAVLIWYTREIQGDRTANIGAGLLLLAMPVLAPMAAGIGWGVGSLVRTLVRGQRPKRTGIAATRT